MKEYTVQSPTGEDVVVQLSDEDAAKAKAKVHDGSVHAAFHERMQANEAAGKAAAQPANKARAAATVKNK